MWNEKQIELHTFELGSENVLRGSFALDGVLASRLGPVRAAEEDEEEMPLEVIAGEGA